MSSISIGNKYYSSMEMNPHTKEPLIRDDIEFKLVIR